MAVTFPSKQKKALLGFYNREKKRQKASNKMITWCRSQKLRNGRNGLWDTTYEVILVGTKHALDWKRLICKGTYQTKQTQILKNQIQSLNIRE